MTGLSIPDNFPLALLVGQEVIQVCIGSHHVRINLSKPAPVIAGVQKWEDGAAIDIEAGFILRENLKPKISATNDNLGRRSGALTVLLGKTISSVEKLSKNELRLCFTGEIDLRLITDPQGFESYHLHIEGDSVDVTIPSAA